MQNQRENTSEASPSLLARASRPVSAPVVDLFRIMAGLLISVYYIRIFREYSLYTSENGILDHELHRELFWFSKVTLFYCGSPDFYKIGLLCLGFAGAMSITLGWRPKLGAVVCWVITVSMHRWNFAVINLDDSSITLLLWWILFLPVGHTLNWETLRGRSSWRKEANLEVNGLFVRAYYCNLFIYYLTAGLTKLTSELWREGLALYVVLNLPLARTQGWWSAEDLPILWAGNHLTLFLEPLFPFLLFLPKGHPVKYFGGIIWFVFHLSIPITIGVPYANFGLILALILVFKGEIKDFIRAKAATSDQEIEQLDWTPPRGTKSLIATYLILLVLAMQKFVPGLKVAYEPAMATLYLGGIAQEYHLFDWIDRFNWTVQHKIVVTPAAGEPFEVDSGKMFERSVRGFIVQSYLLPMRWMRVPRPLTGEMRNGIIRRAVQSFWERNAEELGNSGRVVVNSKVGRLNKDNLQGDSLWDTTLVEFAYDEAGVTIVRPRIPEAEQ